MHTGMLGVCDSSCEWVGTSARQNTALRSHCLGTRGLGVCQLAAGSSGSALPPARIYGSHFARSWRLPAAFCSAMCGAVQIDPGRCQENKATQVPSVLLERCSLKCLLKQTLLHRNTKFFRSASDLLLVRGSVSDTG